MKNLLLLIFLVTSQSVLAKESKITEFSNRCSALFFIMTMPQGDDWKAYSENMSKLSQVMTLIASTAYEKQGLRMNRGQILDKRNIQADNIINSYKRGDADTLSLYSRCDKFRESFALLAMNTSENEMDAVIDKLKVPGNISMDDQKTSLVKMILEKSFQELNANGISSIVELYDSIGK